MGDTRKSYSLPAVKPARCNFYKLKWLRLIQCDSEADSIVWKREDEKAVFHEIADSYS
jgi:hypothetical protein